MIGKRSYKVVMKKCIRRDGTCWGRSYVHTGVILLSTHTKTRPLTDHEITHTFWHEVMHCMLHQMGHPLWNNEVFVDSIGKNLGSIIKTAKFN